MATYAAYRHVELDKVGCGKRSIMKPPGGDCHDIFGADFQGTPAHHRVLKPPGGGTSALFAPTPDETDKPSVNTTVSDTSNVANPRNAVNGIERKGDELFGKSDGNPVTGEGYDTPPTQPPVQQRTRIPPGGYSSGLW